MQELTSTEIQGYCLKLLEYFDLYAKTHNITYYMAGGTLLGAVRHQGFIPWDDDVDLMVPRKDYELLIQSFDGNGRYEVISCETNDRYCTPFARIWDKETRLAWHITSEVEIGVFIDIFPIDGFPPNELISKMYVHYLKLCRTKCNSAARTNFRPGEKYTALKRPLKYVWRKSANYYAKKLNNIAMRYRFEDSKYVGVTTTTAHIYRERNVKDEIFGETIYLPFEHLSLPAPSGYDMYLRHLYGDYMQLPQEEQRVTEHMFTVYAK